MHGIKVAAGIVGAALLMTAVLVGLIYGGIALFGPMWGGIAAIGVAVVLMFVAIAVAENRR